MALTIREFQREDLVVKYQGTDRETKRNLGDTLNCCLFNNDLLNDSNFIQGCRFNNLGFYTVA